MENNTNKNTWAIGGAIIIAGILISGAILLKGTEPNKNKKIELQEKETNLKQEIKIKEISENDHIIGNKNSNIQIIEYSDPDCPYSGLFHEVMNKIINEKSNDISWVYRHYPIRQLHPNAPKEAEATECAFEQGGNDMFWSFTNLLYKNQKDKSENKLENIAKELNLNLDTFKECLNSDKYKNKIENDIINAEMLGINGTPTSFIIKDGKIVDTIPGALPYESVLSKINSLLKN